MKHHIRETKTRVIYKIWNKGSENNFFEDIELVYSKRNKNYKIRRRDNNWHTEVISQVYFEYLLEVAKVDISLYLDRRYKV